MQAESVSTVGQRIARASVALVILSVLGLVTSYLGDVFLAYFFGAGSDLDAFLVASSPYELIGVFAAVQISALIIVFAQVERARGHDAALGVFTRVLEIDLILTAALALTVVLWPLVWIRLLAPNLPAARLALAVNLSRVMAVSLVLTLIVSLLSGLLYARKHFWGPAMAGVLLNISLVVVTVLLARPFGVTAVAIATVAGLVGQIVLLGLIFYQSGLRLRPPPAWSDGDLRQFLAIASRLTIISLLTRGYVLVERNIASGLPAGSIAVLGFASQFSTVPVLLLSAAGAPLFVFLAQQSAEADMAAFRNTLATGLKVVYVLLVPAIGLLAALAAPLIDVFLKRGAFNATAAAQTADVLSILVIGILGWVGADLGTRALWALKHFRASLLLSVVFLASDVVVALALRERWGVLGLAAARSVALLIYGLLTLVTLNRLTRDTEGWQITATLLRLVSAGALAAVTAWLVYAGIISDHSLLREIIVAGLAGLMGLLVYSFVVLRIFRIAEAVRLEHHALERLALTGARAHQWLAAIWS